MPYSARALGQEGLRLRSRRVRSDRSQRLSAHLVVAVLMVVGLAGFVGASVVESGIGLPSPVIPGWMPGPSLAPASAFTTELEDRTYLDALLPIHSRLMQTVLRTGLAASELGQGTPPRARTDLEASVVSYRRIQEQVLALDPPTDLRDSHEAYLGAVRMFERSAVEMLKLYDDGNADHLSRAAPLSLDGMARMRVLSDHYWPR